ncbi:MAG: tRNA-binding protein [Halanaerobiaceae bacterium]
MVEYEDFAKLDIRTGQIKKASFFTEAKKPAFKLWVDFGSEIGIKKSSAQITECYTKDELIGKQVLGVVNFPPKQIASFISEVLILGVYTEEGVILISPEQPVKNGAKLG